MSKGNLQWPEGVSVVLPTGMPYHLERSPYGRLVVVVDSDEDGDLTVALAPDVKKCDARRAGSGAGNCVVQGDGDGNAKRVGKGNGKAVRKGGGRGDADRRGDGDGDALRFGGGEGEGYRTGDGHGNAVRAGAGDGDAVRQGAGDGHAVYAGSAGGGTASRSGLGEGEALYVEEPRWLQSWLHLVEKLVTFTAEDRVKHWDRSAQGAGDAKRSTMAEAKAAWVANTAMRWFDDSASGVFAVLESAPFLWKEGLDEGDWRETTVTSAALKAIRDRFEKTALHAIRLQRGLLKPVAQGTGLILEGCVSRLSDNVADFEDSLISAGRSMAGTKDLTSVADALAQKTIRELKIGMPELCQVFSADDAMWRQVFRGSTLSERMNNGLLVRLRDNAYGQLIERREAADGDELEAEGAVPAP